MPQRRLRGPRISGCSQGPVTRPALTIERSPRATRVVNPQTILTRVKPQGAQNDAPDDAFEPKEMRTYRHVVTCATIGSFGRR